jgi:hypothetical protein
MTFSYPPSLANVFLALAKGEHLQPSICPHCQSEDIKPTDDTGEEYECTQCGAVFDAS